MDVPVTMQDPRQLPGMNALGNVLPGMTKALLGTKALPGMTKAPPGLKALPGLKAVNASKPWSYIYRYIYI